MRSELFGRIREYSLQNGIFIDRINGGNEHVHLLLSLGASQSISDVVGKLKGASAHWINRSGIRSFRFAWQDSYFAVSVSESQVANSESEVVIAADALIATPAPAPKRDARVFAATDADAPLIINGQGEILQRGEDGLWRVLPLETPANDVYVDANSVTWAATSAGLYRSTDKSWTLVDNLPVTRLDLMHGYLFALGKGHITQAPAGGGSLESPRRLDTPLPDQDVVALTMLGDHSHIIVTGGQLFLTLDLGLTWQPVSAPDGQTVQMVATDASGNLLATTRDALYTWVYSTQTWNSPVALPDNDSSPIIKVLNNELYAVGGGRVLRFLGLKWLPLRLPEGDGIFMTGLTVQYPQMLWAVDSASDTLWSSSDGINWARQVVEIAPQ